MPNNHRVLKKEDLLKAADKWTPGRAKNKNLYKALDCLLKGVIGETVWNNHCENPTSASFLWKNVHLSDIAFLVYGIEKSHDKWMEERAAKKQGQKQHEAWKDANKKKKKSETKDNKHLYVKWEHHFCKIVKANKQIFANEYFEFRKKQIEKNGGPDDKKKASTRGSWQGPSLDEDPMRAGLDD